MIKKITTIFLIFLLNITPVMARVGTPTFDFEIPDLFNNPDVPSGERKKDDGGLSGGAVTAITLGSIGGAALLGLGGWLYRKKVSQCLTAGCIQGAKNHLIPFCMERNADAEVYVRINNNYPYLKKALSLNEIHYCPDSQYLLIYDTVIGKRKFDSVRFCLPQGVQELRITQVSDPFEGNDLTAEIFLYKNDSNTEEPVIANLSDCGQNSSKSGVLIKTLNTNFKEYKTASYVVSNYTEKKIYAVVIEFVYRK